MDDGREATGPISDRRVVLLWALVLACLHGFFFQGGGWNQNARFDTVRALVERGSFDISPYADNTGDVVEHGGKVFANKPPGHALLAAPVYFLLFQLERAAGLSPDDPAVANANVHALTWFSSGLPACGVALLLVFVFRKRGATRREAMILATAFATGSLLMPYSGVLIAHNLTALLLFAAWVVLVTPGRGPGRAALAGGLLGWAVLSEFLAAPAAVILAGYALWQRPSPRETAALLAGPTLCAGILLLHNLSSFGDPFTTVYTASSTQFTESGLWLGVFDWPQPMRLYWLTLHPFRGLLYACPVFLVSGFALRSPTRLRRMRAESGVAAAIVASFVLFNLSFNGWTGGWCFGPRYLIPALPFLFLPALAGLRRLPGISATLAVVSTAFMLCVSSVMVMVPVPDTGDPPDFDPLLYTVRVLARGHVSHNNQGIHEPFPDASGDDAWDSWNLGEVAGLEGRSSLIPALGLVFASYALAGARWQRPRRGRR